MPPINTNALGIITAFSLACPNKIFGLYSGTYNIKNIKTGCPCKFTRVYCHWVYLSVLLELEILHPKGNTPPKQQLMKLYRLPPPPPS